MQDQASKQAADVRFRNMLGQRASELEARGELEEAERLRRKASAKPPVEPGVMVLGPKGWSNSG